MLEPAGGSVRALLRLVPHKDVLVAYDVGGEPPAGSSLLANLTVRMHFVSALEASAGSGLHALVAARHTDRVVAIDSDSRALELPRFGALLNGLDNLECREGPSLEPVAGHSFGLVVANPRSVISPDDAERGDSLCRELVRGIPAHLSEGGFAHVLVSWILGAGEDWWKPLEEWVEGTGCDAWLLLTGEEDPVAYAAAHAGTADAEGLDRWTQYLGGLAADRVASGAIVLRRRTRARNWTHHEILPTADVGPAATRSFVPSSITISSTRFRGTTSSSTRCSRSSSRSASSRRGGTRTKAWSWRAPAPGWSGGSGSSSAWTRTRSSSWPASTGAGGFAISSPRSRGTPSSRKR